MHLHVLICRRAMRKLTDVTKYLFVRWLMELINMSEIECLNFRFWPFAPILSGRYLSPRVYRYASGSFVASQLSAHVPNHDSSETCALPHPMTE